MDGLDYRDARLGRDDWIQYAGRLGAVEGRRARLLRNKIEAALATVPAAAGDAVVLALTRSDRALLRELDQQELDALLAAWPDPRPDPTPVPVPAEPSTAPWLPTADELTPREC